jgi:glycerol-3-phosphate acyltransferase PlsY
MDLAPSAGIAFVGGFLCGSIPFAWIVVRLRKGVDLRTVGSGNVGATNATRVLGRGWFPLLFALDFAKGAAPVLAANITHLAATRETMPWVDAAAGLGAVLGHMFPPWLGFRGGKGVATGAGALLPLAGQACLAGFVAFAVTAAIFRYVSLGSVVASVTALSVFLRFSGATPPGQRWPIAGFLALLCVVIVVKHLPNLRRIAAGTEPRIFGKQPAAAGEAAREE